MSHPFTLRKSKASSRERVLLNRTPAFHVSPNTGTVVCSSQQWTCSWASLSLPCSCGTLWRVPAARQVRRLCGLGHLLANLFVIIFKHVYSSVSFQCVSGEKKRWKKYCHRAKLKNKATEQIFHCLFSSCGLQLPYSPISTQCSAYCQQTDRSFWETTFPK